MMAGVAAHCGLIQDEVAGAVASNGAALIIADHNCRLGRGLGALSALSEQKCGHLSYARPDCRPELGLQLQPHITQRRPQLRTSLVIGTTAHCALAARSSSASSRMNLPKSCASHALALVVTCQSLTVPQRPYPSMSDAVWNMFNAHHVTVYLQLASAARGSWLQHLLVEGLGLVGQAAVGGAVLEAQLVGVAAQHPRQHRGHRQVHRHLAAHLPQEGFQLLSVAGLHWCSGRASNSSAMPVFAWGQ